jgi:hypothetical protein
MTVTLSVQPSPSNGASFLDGLQLLPFRPDFDEWLEVFLQAKVLLSRTRITYWEIGELLLQRRQTGLSLAHLALKNHFCTYEEALTAIATYRTSLDVILGKAADNV